MTLTRVIESAQRAERAGNWDVALDLYQQALETVREQEDAVRLAELLRWIGKLHRLRGDLELAEVAYRESLQAAETSGRADLVASALNVWAVIQQAYGNVDVAET
ncbi:MAG TPA: tetratricopeptide repeat protein, partial [Longimicrobiales bacterium]